MTDSARPVPLMASLRELATSTWRKLHKRFAGSMLGLLTLSFLLVCTPLVLGLLVAGQRVEQATQQSESLLQAAIERTQAFRLTQETLISLERAARLFQILRDQEALERLDSRHSSFRTQLNASAAFTATPEIVSVRQQLQSSADRLSVLILQQGAGASTQGLNDAFQQTGQLVSELLARNDQAVNAELDRLRDLGRQARRATQVQLVLIIPFALVMAMLLANLLNRPLRKLDHGIRLLTRPSSEPIPEIRSPRDLRALSVRLRWARRKLDRAAKERQQFIAQVSHELKTPLSALQEGVSLLDDEVFGVLAPRQREVLSILKSNGKRLQQQIESLLRFNRLMTTEMKVRPKVVRTAELARQVLADQAFALQARELVLDTSLDNDLKVLTDPDMLRTSLDNLVSNAVKFSPAGGRIGVGCYREGQTVQIEVSNQGPEIPASERPRLFDPFYRGRHEQGAIPGTGLGLAITRDLLHAIGGEVYWVRRDGWSTTFRISLPALQPEHQGT
ncbi:MAG: sensor histidine kinase [Wenzhouxiangellaceae bacterium]